MLGIIGVAALFVIIAVKLDEKHVPLKLLFIMVSIFLCLIAVGAAAEIEAFNQALGGSAQDILDLINTAYKVVLYTIYFTIGYFIIYFIWWVAVALGDQARK